MNFVLVDETKGVATVGDGSVLTPEILQAIASAAMIQLNRDVAAHWGIPNGSLVRVSDGTDTQPGECVFAILPTLPNAPSAIAYHDINGKGVPVLYDALSLSDSLILPGNSLSVAITHELDETECDPPCNIWRDGMNTVEYAQEVCDPVEASDYMITVDNGQSVAVANFVFPEFFNPLHDGPYDFLGLIKVPFQNLAGGYQIERDIGMNEHSVFAKGQLNRRKEKRKHPSSRSYKRGLRI